jgi:hypothetical protein
MAATRVSEPTIVQAPTQMPTMVPTQAPATLPGRTSAPPAGSKKPLLIAGIAAVLLFVIGVAAYEILIPTPHPSGGGSSAGPAPAQTISPDGSGPPSQATHTIDEAPSPANSGATAPPAPAPKPERSSRQPAPKSKPSEPASDQGQQMYQKAQAAFSQQRYFEPANDSALHWAILARQAGNPAGKALEEQIIGVYKTRVAQYYNSGNYAAALALVNEMLKFYPGNASLLAQQKKFQDALSNSKH